MKIETRTEIVPIYNMLYGEYGDIVDVEYIGNQKITITDIYADEGKVFVEKSTGKALSSHITLGTEDSIENYGEITQ